MSYYVATFILYYYQFVFQFSIKQQISIADKVSLLKKSSDILFDIKLTISPNLCFKIKGCVGENPQLLTSTVGELKSYSGENKILI